MFIKSILPRKLKTFLIEYKYIFSEIPKNHRKKLKSIKINYSLSLTDEKNWINKFNKATFSNRKIIGIAEDFFNSEIEVIRDLEVTDSDLICICVEKNDITKLKRFIDYHRGLGVDKFVILDNNSDDGTIEFLLKQKDVIVLKDKSVYSSDRRVAWINRIVAHYGYDRWYFVADADELLAYRDSENKSIKELIKYYEENKIVRARALLLDMYAKPEYYVSGKAERYYEECVYFDTDTYEKFDDNRFLKYIGGPRKRVFDISLCVTKYPLVYMRKKDIYIDSHYLYPYQDNFKSECNIVLKHYKFIPNEFDKIKEIAESGIFYNGSIEYKHYINVLKKNKKLDFFYDNTNKYDNSKSLNKINIYKEIDLRSK